MADVQPFRAVRYSGAAGPLVDLVAPPYDAVSSQERDLLFTRSPYNVVHLTLPDSPEEAGRLYRAWLVEGVLEQEDEPSAWLLAEDFVGPDGVLRERCGLVVSLAAEPYESGRVLPHERTHAPIREDRFRLLRELRAQPEPIFLLASTDLGLELPDAPPVLEANGSRLWRLSDPDLGRLERAELLIADGHHRYESALALGEAEGRQARVLALVVPTFDPGLHVFPTHRVFRGRPDLGRAREGVESGSLDDALARLAKEPYERSAAVAVRPGSVELVQGNEGELDVELVDRHGLDGIAYTHHAAEAVAAVERNGADVAFLLREPRVEDVFAVARDGKRMPQKSTYFYPKPLSGLLFHPLDQ
jgi:uncharacterized protein (DUF1015 family)